MKRPSIASSLSKQALFLDYQDDFNHDKLGLNWLSFRNTKQAYYQLKDGYLLMQSRDKLGDSEGFPSFVGVRQQQNEAEIKTSVQFDTHSDGDRAGVVAMQSDDSYVFYGIEQVNDQRKLVVSLKEKNEPEEIIKSVALNKGHLDLSVTVNKGKMTFNYSISGNKKSLLIDFDCRFLSTLQADGFVGTVIGLYTYSR